MKTLFTVLLTVAAVTADSGFCTPGLSFTTVLATGCNTCTCTEDGLAIRCTEMACPSGLTNKNATTVPQKICNPRGQFKNYCNTCSCADDGKSISCTNLMCDENIWNQDGSLKVRVETSVFDRSKETKKVCEPESLFADYCNTCWCNTDGLSYSCTTMKCHSKLWNKDGSMNNYVGTIRALKKVCKPHILFRDSCNTCLCSPYGQAAACTSMICDPKIWNNDNSLNIAIPKEQEEGSKNVCEPNTVFKEYCNTCTCDENGRIAFCTYAACSHDIWNKNGTLKKSSIFGESESKNKPTDPLCEPHSVFEKFCKSCICSEDGSTATCSPLPTCTAYAKAVTPSKTRENV